MIDESLFYLSEAPCRASARSPTYGNAERLDWRKYVPTAIRVEYSNMDPVEGEDPQDMKSYAKKSSTVVTNLVPF